MPVEPRSLLDHLVDQAESTRRSLKTARHQQVEAPPRLRRLARRRTEAFCDLARHYLPELTHEALAAAWVEVRDQIGDVLLRQNDQRRRLRTNLQQVRSARQQAERELESLQQQQEQARLDLAAKTGNYKRELRLDPSVSKCIEQIDKIDKEIERSLSELDTLKTHADRKLPDYEESSLFSYLKDRKFGTPAYQEDGLERRWDRWVAKLIDYEKAKESFDFLHQAPQRVQQLIDEKRDRYKQLLDQLETSRERVMTQFGVQQQTKLWLSLCEQVRDLEQAIEQHGQDERRLDHKLQQAHVIDGAAYQEAIAVYRKFLEDLDPEIMRVYAACTESPVDDEICARVRGIQDEIASEQQLSKRRADEIETLERYLTGLQEIIQHLKQELRGPGEIIEVDEKFRLQPLLDQLRARELSPSQIWRRICAALIHKATLVEPPVVIELAPLEASFLAAAGSHPQVNAEPFDATRVVLSRAAKPSAGRQKPHQFRLLVKCMTVADAQSIVALLEAQGIRSFAHDDTIDRRSLPPGLVSLGEIRVMVESNQYEAACRLVRDLRRDSEVDWTCRACDTRVDRGYHHCWSCGKPRERWVAGSST